MIDQDIELELSETTYKLRPTLEAMKKINSRFGSLLDGGERIVRYDVSAISFVIAAGAGLTQKQVPHMEAELVGNLERAVGPVGKYFALLMRGGADTDEEEPATGEA